MIHCLKVYKITSYSSNASATVFKHFTVSSILVKYVSTFHLYTVFNNKHKLISILIVL